MKALWWLVVVFLLCAISFQYSTVKDMRRQIVSKTIDIEQIKQATDELATSCSILNYQIDVLLSKEAPAQEINHR